MENKFIRRDDLTPQIRMFIAFTAMMAMTFGDWGTITNLSREFTISRTFVYMLASRLELASQLFFGISSVLHQTPDCKDAYRYMLSLRMEGKCSIVACSTIMKRFEIKLSSVGSVSQYLSKFGSFLPTTLPAGIVVQVLVFASDEIFSKKTPILVTVDPISSAILRVELADSRNADVWANHWECLIDNGYCVAYLVCDEGKGLCKARKEALADVFRQSDTYHAVAHILGMWVRRLEEAAYNAIEAEDDAFKKLDSAKSEKVINKRIDKCEKAKQVADEAIELYETFNFLYECLIEELKVFDKNGKLRDRKEVEENIRISLDLIEDLGKTAITTAARKVRRALPDLFNYLDVAKEVVDELEQMDIDPHALRALCLAWQWNKAVIKSKKTARTKYCKMNQEFCLEFATGHLQDEFDNIKDHVFNQLDQIVQSSAMVECINSIIRPYLDTTKNKINQNFLNLIMFYHNHRRYNAGKRKGKTPMEILSGKEQEKNWIDLLFDIVERKDPSFFSAVSRS
ncbi:MAG: hypothetical protein GY749_18150 [Desulfobacteraceae bacterium]|nr:hypothetical protein [Desulfobacteraceae bacterium]